MSASAVESLLRGAGYTSVRPLPLPFSCEFSLPQAKYTEAEYVELAETRMRNSALLSCCAC